MAGSTGPTKSAEGRGRNSAARPAAEADSGPPPSGSRGARTRAGARRARLRALLVLFALALALTGFGAWALYGSNWVLVERVSVSGTQVLTEKQVRDAARIPVGTPLLSVDRSAAERRLKSALPRLDEVRVVRAWPHGIGIEVSERKPELAMRHEEKFVEVDVEGVRFDVVPEQPKGVPLLVMEVQRSAGLRHFGKERLRREAVRVVTALPDSVARDTRTVRLRSYDSITLELTGGRTVLWGSGEQGIAKAESLTALMKASKGARHFDVSVPSAPASSGS
ncbi:cell division protein FtsQ/DivIB [Streptomyces winkii]|uniref:cell division protein FtsQ/DivIB n=1 Tax=Streptomyces winkii TaxID=3051178 RepID=UPI0028D648C8|nr:FtsQ-type POTRA domain-containing protein [Streptomyces sp. DSM 40971]